VKLAVVVQRYGADINGGAELHARYIAERLAPHADVRVLTTCARDYITWRNELPPGHDRVNGVEVERFAVSRERVAEDFARRSRRVFDSYHSLDDELRWLVSEGPVCPGLIERLRRRPGEFDFVLLFSVRYYQAYFGAQAVPERAVLVPTAEREASLGLRVFQRVFRGVRAIMYNSFEEQALIGELSSNQHVPGVVVGVGSEIPAAVDGDRARQKFGLFDPFIVYVGRIDENKGCSDLFQHFQRYIERSGQRLDLVLIGRAVLPVPRHPRIRHLGFLSDPDKFDTIAASTLLVVPSRFESLSMVALEAWALGRPVMANAACDVLVGQCIRSNAGLYYSDAREFGAVLDWLLAHDGLAAVLGANGRSYYERHYRWSVVERAYLDMFERLQQTPPPHTIEPMPGWLARRRRHLPPAASVVDGLTSGAVVGSRRIDGAGRGDAPRGGGSP
jgi:glycosyltransferase involved in cell wall biosynthesis